MRKDTFYVINTKYTLEYYYKKKLSNIIRNLNLLIFSF
jgi:hypothetical protein